MTPAGFLTAFAQAISTMALYREGHPARERVIDAAWEGLLRLRESGDGAAFTFIGDEVVWGTQPVRELKAWDWGRRLSEAGMQRLEIDDGVSREEFEGFLEEVLARLAWTAGSAEARQMRSSRIRFGTVGLRSEPSASPQPELPPVEGHEGVVMLQEEIETLQWLHDEVQSSARLHLAEAEAVVRSLSVTMHGESRIILPLLRMRAFDEYTTTHAMNVSVLAMALSEFIGLGPKDVRTFGVAGLLHDIGKVHVPLEILTKAGKLTPEERAIMNMHTVEGARIIISTEEQLDLAAIVAYEHHIMIDGGGYPAMRWQRDVHYGSRIVHVCDVYDALRTRRPYRDAWDAEKVLDYIGEKAGTEFDHDLAHAFTRMMREWEPRMATGSWSEP
ncbi:MAG TPA: HD domain-containing phosphohydrolase [Longimicrobiales bacterium]